jgi:hypothetical protein
MSEMSEKARSEGKEKVKRLTDPGKDKVDASGWTEDEYGSGLMHTEKKLGNRPISKQNLATGGKAAHRHAGRKSRDMGGPMSSAGQNYVANVPAPPQNRFSFTGNQSPLLAAAGMKKGGKLKRADGGQAEEIEGKRPVGGRMARKDGGSTGKGKMNVNIIIAQKPDHQMMPGGAPGGAMPPKPPMPMPPPGAPPPMGGPQGAPAGPMPGGPNMPPPSMQPPMGRKDGGKVYPDMKFSAANGKGRLEKAKKYGC